MIIIDNFSLGSYVFSRYEVVFSIEDYVGLEGLVKWNQDSEVGIKIQNVKVVDSGASFYFSFISNVKHYITNFLNFFCINTFRNQDYARIFFRG